ncbi:pyrroloquinoline quinone precursor peptide PqqA [Streptoalloteichus hindustanus]|uniref:Coenzyme PQQ synthesis protein A n=1 Tax=Streptoalloteichus hindustanus TaxID=2017 RepID=A0A1M5KRF5_STRHI|nr:pyrroloquinoline quinone precursor peptide PqqA [Streptoalloteichus hindustanus]SHG55367.1 coenzyme PQQ precursor peptide PqqA [Streptoalloteichus hindustanus]
MSTTTNTRGAGATDTERHTTTDSRRHWVRPDFTDFDTAAEVTAYVARG